MHTGPVINWYSINLDSDLNRRESILKEAASFGAEICRVSAVDAKTLNDVDRNFVARGVRAVWLSHIKVMELFLASNADFAIITEDDFHIEGSTKLRKVFSLETTFDFDLVQFGFLLPGIDTRVKVALANLQHSGFSLLAKLGNLPFSYSMSFLGRVRVREADNAPRGFIMYDCQPGAHFYLISRRFASEIAALNSPQFLSIDDFYTSLSKMRSFKMARLRKSIVSQLPFPAWAGDRFKTSRD
jgi:GR25 family glycosyltransferase involved in LPS biosynthesis